MVKGQKIKVKIFGNYFIDRSIEQKRGCMPMAPRIDEIVFLKNIVVGEFIAYGVKKGYTFALVKVDGKEKLIDLDDILED